ncbi:MAG TPA: trigger factor, partial [Chloroflexia bacterium]|nr:trigger factor [Chloroflexia bacterium]
MQITREDMPDRQVALLIEFEPQEIEPALQKTYQRLVGKVNIPGFRPGKAPRAIFERYVGREALVQEASESLMAGAIKDALERESLQGAELNNADIESTDPLRVRVLFDLEPLVEVPDYSDIRVTAEPVEVTDTHVDELIDRMRRRDAEWHDPSEPRPARLGDRVTVDLETFTIDGPVPEMTGTGQTLELSEHTGPAWPREIDENLIGMQVGEEKDFAITFPEGYTDEKLRGREATVHAKVTALQEADLPELDDEFASRVAQAENVEAMRAKLQADLLEETTRSVRSRQAQATLAALLERSTVEVSSAMIDNEIDHRFERLTEQLQQRKIAPARYFTYEGTTEKAWRESQREPARAALKELLVLRDFAAREQVTVDDADVAAEMDKLLAPYAEHANAEQLRGLIDTPEQREGIHNRLFEQKLADRLIAVAEGRAELPPAAGDAGADDAVSGRTPGAAEGAAPDGTDAAAAEEPAEYVAPAVSGSVPATEQEPG